MDRDHHAGGNEMGFLELVRARYSVRSYDASEVEEEKLLAVLQAARLAPSAANRQPVRLIVVRTEGREQELRRVYDRAWFATAPFVICACIVPEEGWVRDDGRAYADFDAALMLDHLTLAAAELGLGTCWVAAFDPRAAREVLEVPAHAEPVAFVTLGYPAGEPPDKERKALDQIVRYDRW